MNLTKVGIREFRFPPGTDRLIEAHRFQALRIVCGLLFINTVLIAPLAYSLMGRLDLVVVRAGPFFLLVLVTWFFCRRDGDSSRSKWIFTIGAGLGMLFVRLFTNPAVASQYLHVVPFAAVAILFIGFRPGLLAGGVLLASLTGIDQLNMRYELFPRLIVEDPKLIYFNSVILGLCAVGLLGRLLRDLIAEGITTNELLTQMFANDRRLFSVVTHDIGNLVMLARLSLETKNHAKTEEAMDQLIGFIGDIRMLHSNGQSHDLSSASMPLSRMFELLEFYGRDAANLKNVDLKIVSNVPLDTKLPVSSPVLLHGVLGNLLHNAIKFSPQGAVIEIQCRREAGGFVIDIADQGDGLPAQVLKAVQNGTPSPTSTLGTAGEKGSGIGLWNAFEMARRIHCDLESLPRQPKGTVARIFISQPKRNAED